MPDLNHKFQAGKMNKDLDERLVPNGEYRDALNIEVATSEGSDMGAAQTIMGNINLSNFGIGKNDGFCVASIVNEKNDKLYWFISSNGTDIIAEYDFHTKAVVPVMVDLFTPGTIADNESGRALNFDPAFLITGINIIDDIIFWTDNNTEPKRVNIERGKMGSPNFNTQTQFYVRNTLATAPNSYIPIGPVKHEHLTVIKKSPPIAPVLEMRSFNRLDIDGDGVSGEISTTITTTENLFQDANSGDYREDTFTITFDSSPDFQIGDTITISFGKKEIRAVIQPSNFNIPDPPNATSYCDIIILSGDPGLVSTTNVFNVVLEQPEPLFKFKFPRFAYRYKYEDGEYSSFSPFTEVAFLPGDFDYLPKEGYNLGMVNMLRDLAVRDFVHRRLLPDDVVSIDILYKESNSPNIYSVKTVKRKSVLGPSIYNEWNADSSTTVTTNAKTTGYIKIPSELIHAVLPSNQLLRPWDNVPRMALAQEVVGNRIVYGNYLQNYNISNKIPSWSHALKYNKGGSLIKAQDKIDIDLKLAVKSRDLGILKPEQYNPWHAVLGYSPAKSIKTLRTYQLGVVYRDEFGRETPVFSDSKSDRSSLYLDKKTADQATKLKAQIYNNHPSWAKSFKFFIKETSNEYYNLAMDRWYDAADGNVWISFPSAERNKVDEDTFLILKKQHDFNIPVLNPARYKVIAIENEVPLFVKTEKVPQGAFFDVYDTATAISLVGLANGVGWPEPEKNAIYFEIPTFESIGWAGSAGTEGKLYKQDLSLFKFRVKTPSGRSNWYDIISIEYDPSIGTSGFYIVKTKNLFGADMSITSPTGTHAGRHLNMEVELVKEEVKNKPEYEGRFFVKILKDTELINTIIHPPGTSTNYLVTQSIVSQYINPSASIDYGPGNAWVGDWYGTTPHANRHLISISPNNNAGGSSHADQKWGIGPQGDGYTYWNRAGKSTVNQSSGWFIDKIEGFRRFKNTHEEWGNDNSFVTNSYNQSSSKPDLRPANQLQLMGTNTMGSGGPINYLNISSNTHPGITLRNADEGVGGKIVPSNGIDPTTGIIHLSFSGVGGEDTGSGNAPNSLSGMEHHFGAAGWASTHTSDALFINEITTPGTIWRWDEDPGQTVYRTVPFIAPGTVGAYTSDEWTANQTDTFDGEPGVALFNYTKFADYVIDNHHGVRFVWKPLALGVLGTWQDISRFWVSASISDHDHTCYTPPILGPTLWVPCYLYNRGLHWGASKWGGYWLTCGHDDSSVATSGGWSNTSSNGFGFGDGRYPMMTEDWGKYINKRRRFQFKAEAIEMDPATSEPYGLGQVPPHNYLPTNDPMLPPHFDNTGTALTATSTPVLPSSIAPGIRPDGMYTGHVLPGAVVNVSGGYQIDDPLGVTQTYYTIPKLRMEDNNLPNSRVSKEPGSVTWQILEPWAGVDEETNYSSTNPAIFETEPKEDVGLEIYHEVGQIYPIELDDTTIEQFVGAIHNKIELNPRVTCWNPNPTSGGWVSLDTDTTGAPLTIFTRTDIRVSGVIDNEILLTDSSGVILDGIINANQVIPSVGDRLIFTRSDGSSTEAQVIATGNSATNAYTLSPYVHNFEVTLPWFNCYSFGNGVESDRIRDDFNQVTIDNGPKASTTLEEHYAEERRGSGLIYSGIYNSMSGINNLNQFIMAEKITKDLNPIYGSIQKLHTRNTNLLTLCEDKVFKILANKDALYNADGSINLTATENVLGQTTPLLGEFGISTNPESFAFESYRTYFSDKTRGVVVRVSQDGMTPISDVGMKDYFGDRLILSNRIIGSFDDKKEEYNITLGHRDFPILTPPTDKGTWEVNIEGASKTGYAPYLPTGFMYTGVAIPLAIGNLIVGPGIPPNTIVTNIIHLGGNLGLKVEFNQPLAAWEASVLNLGASWGGGGAIIGTAWWYTEITIFGVNNTIPSTYTNVVGTACEEEWIIGGPTTGSNQTVIRPYFNNGNLPSTVNSNGVVGGTVVTDVSCDCDESHTTSNPCTDVCAFKDIETVGGTFFQWSVGDVVKMPSGRVWKKIQGPGVASNLIGPMTNPERPDGVGSEYWEECCEHDYGCGDVTISFSEISKGWSSFKSFIQEDGVSLNNTYYTFNGGDLYEHAANNLRNNFYNQQFDSSITTLFNEAAGSVKGFQTLNYEGTQSKITSDITSSGEYWDNEQQFGWYVNKMHTNLQQVGELQFKNKEGKWFAQIQGETTEWLDDGEAGNIDVREFAYQGIDEASAISIITGGYTSWECQPGSSVYCPSSNETPATWTREIIGDPWPTACNFVKSSMLRWFFDDPSRHNYKFKEHYFTQFPDGTGVKKVLPIDHVAGYGGLYNVSRIIDFWKNIYGGGMYNAFILPGMDLDSFLAGLYSFNAGNGATPDGWSYPLPAIVTPAFLAANPASSPLNIGEIYPSIAGAIGVSTTCYPCVEVGDPDSGYECISIEGLGGTYATQSECLADPSTLCGLIGPTWNCCEPRTCTQEEDPSPELWSCYDPGDGSGDHQTLEDCQNACIDPCTILNNLTVTTTDATSANGCADGTVTVDVTILNGASQWYFTIEDPLGGIFYTDPNNPYIGNTSTVPYVHMPGGFGYIAVIIDDMGCRNEIPFNIGCTATPCPTGSYVSAAGTATSPHNSYFGAWHPTGSGGCEDGIVWANMLVFGNGTTWTVDWYTVPVMGSPILIWDDPTVYTAATTSSDQLTGLAAGNYQYTVTDDLGCVYTYNLTLTCVGVPCDGPTNVAWSMTETKVGTTSCEYSPTVGAPTTVMMPGTATLTVSGFSTFATGNYDVTWKKIDGTTIGTSPGIAIGVGVTSPSLTPTAAQLASGPEPNCVNGPCTTPAGGSCTPQNPSSLITSYQFIMEITDSDGCLSIIEFCVPCQQWVSAPIMGCTNSLAFNFNPLATIDDGSCCLIAGCTDPNAGNYNPIACHDDGSCIPVITTNQDLRYDCSGQGVDWNGAPPSTWPINTPSSGIFPKWAMMDYGPNHMANGILGNYSQDDVDDGHFPPRIDPPYSTSGPGSANVPVHYMRQRQTFHTTPGPLGYGPTHPNQTHSNHYWDLSVWHAGGMAKQPCADPCRSTGAAGPPHNDPPSNALAVLDQERPWMRNMPEVKVVDHAGNPYEDGAANIYKPGGPGNPCINCTTPPFTYDANKTKLAYPFVEITYRIEEAVIPERKGFPEATGVQGPYNQVPNYITGAPCIGYGASPTTMGTANECTGMNFEWRDAPWSSLMQTGGGGGTVPWIGWYTKPEWGYPWTVGGDNLYVTGQVIAAPSTTPAVNIPWTSPTGNSTNGLNTAGRFPIGHNWSGNNADFNPGLHSHWNTWMNNMRNNGARPVGASYGSPNDHIILRGSSMDTGENPSNLVGKVGHNEGPPSWGIPHSGVNGITNPLGGYSTHALGNAVCEPYNVPYWPASGLHGGASVPVHPERCSYHFNYVINPWFTSLSADDNW